MILKITNTSIRNVKIFYFLLKWRHENLFLESKCWVSHLSQKLIVTKLQDREAAIIMIWIFPHSLNRSFWLLKALPHILSIQCYLVHSCEWIAFCYLWNFSFLKTKSISYFSYTCFCAPTISLFLCTYNQMVKHLKKNFLL